MKQLFINPNLEKKVKIFNKMIFFDIAFQDGHLLSQYHGRCSCRDNNVSCTELCNCGSKPEMCTNIEATNESDSEIVDD